MTATTTPRQRSGSILEPITLPADPTQQPPAPASEPAAAAVDTPPAAAGVASLTLPKAPTDDELLSYFGPQRRWILICMMAGFLAAYYTLVQFALATAAFLFVLPLLVLGGAHSAASLLSSHNRRRLTREGHLQLVANWRPARYPSVDVYLPTAGEPIEILLNSYWHVRHLAWPGPLTVYVLDDGGRPEVQAAARRHGFTYVSRPDRGHLKKAGNLQYALTRSTGEFIAIFDADFCPRGDFLVHLMPYTDRPDVGIVQSPQCFDTAESMGWLQRSAGATQELFYRWVQPSRDAVRSAICVGTNAVYRRAGLVAAGGFAQIGHSEDVHTGINLRKCGYHVAYIPVILAKGLCPNDINGFMNQQYRWCAGSMSLLKREDFRRLRMGFRSRICYWAGFLYYISTAVNVFALHVPSLVMSYAYPGEVRPSHLIPFLLVLWVWFVLIPITFRTRWRVEVIRLQMLYSFCHAVAIFHTLRGSTAGWVATGATGRAGGAARSVTVLTLTTLTTLTVAEWVGLAWAGWTHGWEQYWPLLMFHVGYCYMTLPLIKDLTVSSLEARRAARGDQRSHRRSRRRPRSLRLGGPRVDTSYRAPGAAGRSSLGPVSPGSAERQPVLFGHRVQQVRWPEALLVTSVLVLLALVASEWTTPSLLWAR